MTFLRLVSVSALIVMTGCGRSQSSPMRSIRVAAASDLQNVLPKLVQAYREVSATEVVVTFGASGQLAEQIKAGAPFDLFLAANRKYVDDLAKLDHVVADSVASYAIGSLVIAVHKDAPVVEILDDLMRPEIKRVAIANPDFAPYGAAARQALRASGLWDRLQTKIVLAETVRQTLQYVQTGNAEAGLVSQASADVSGVRIVAIDAKLYDPIIQNLGIVKGSENQEEAERFRRFLLGSAGRALFSSHGFAIPDSQERSRP